MNMTKFRQFFDEYMTLMLNKWHGANRWLFIGMLTTLHLALWAGVNSIWSRPLLFAHLGLFLMWQPLWRGEEKLRNSSVAMILGVTILAMFWLNWWLLTVWVSGLFAFVGGRVFAYQNKLQRFQYLMSMAYLLAVQLLWVTPRLFALPATIEVGEGLMQAALPVLLLVLLLIPPAKERIRKTEAIDLIYSAMLFMLLAILVLGSLAFMMLQHADYFSALLRTLFSIALVLFVLGWLWNPRLGFSGFRVLFSQYFQNIGTPFEQWLKQLALFARHEDNPEEFLKISMQHLAELPWLTGLHWECERSKGQSGVSSQFDIHWVDHDLKLTLYTRYRLAPAVQMHIHLFFQILAHFYLAKRHEQRLRELVRLQAVHEMGARVTHELKNMLQSLLTLIAVAEVQPVQAQALLSNQLPVLAKQIEIALGKLKTPRIVEEADMVDLEVWWNNLRQRHQYSGLEWVLNERAAGVEVVGKMFDSIADNLIENVRNKRMREPGISARVSLQVQPLGLMICDTGSAVPEAISAKLLNTVVDSEDGLGVGLYQAAAWAEQLGYRLRLRSNDAGRVCFELRKVS